jgi:heterodisulfide reductase subunit C
MSTVATETRTKTFFDEVISRTPGEERLAMCIQCGTCGGSCPSGQDMDRTPREMIAMIASGLRKEALSSNAPWFCVSCYYCMVRCPQEIHITDIMYTLKRMSVEAGLHEESTAKDAPGFSQDFISFVENYGRSFELGLATFYHMKHHFWSMPGMAGMGLGMLSKKRMDLTPRKIKNLDQLKAILAKAKQIDAETGGTST